MATSLLLPLLPSTASFFPIYHNDSQGSFCKPLYWTLYDKDNLTCCSTSCKNSSSSISAPERNYLSTLALYKKNVCVDIYIIYTYTLYIYI